MIIATDELRTLVAEFLKAGEHLKLNEKILEFITEPKKRVGAADELSKQAAIDRWRQEGMLLIWDYIRSLSEPAKPEVDASLEDNSEVMI
jgi:hypothetical protein